MLIAQKLRQENIVGYMLYMYQVEDTIRAFHADMDAIEKDYLPRFNLEGDALGQAREWYSNLCRMLHEEGCMEKGHVQVVRNTIILMEDRHKELLQDTKQPFYSAAYYKALPYIVELRAKGANREKEEIENCLDAVYGTVLLKMQGRKLSAQTQAALQPITHLLEMLAQLYKEIPEQ